MAEGKGETMGRGGVVSWPPSLRLGMAPSSYTVFLRSLSLLFYV